VCERHLLPSPQVVERLPQPLDLAGDHVGQRCLRVRVEVGSQDGDTVQQALLVGRRWRGHYPPQLKPKA